MVGSCKWPVSRTRSGFILYTTAATAVFANEPLRSQFRRPTPHYGCDNLLTLPRFPIPRVTQSVGVRVGSGSHLLSGLKPTFTVGDRKPWHEQLNLLLITGTAPRSSLRTCMHGRCTQVSILPNTLLGSSLGTGRSHGGCFHRCLGNIPLPRREWSQDWLTALRYAWSVLLPTSPCELYFYFLCHQRILLGLTLILGSSTTVPYPYVPQEIAPSITQAVGSLIYSNRQHHSCTEVRASIEHGSLTYLQASHRHVHIRAWIQMVAGTDPTDAGL